MSQASTGERLLRLKQILPRLGLSRTTFFDKIRSGEFPAPIKLGQRISLWPESQIDALVAKIIAKDF